MSLFATVPKDQGDAWLAGQLNDAGLFQSAELPAPDWYLWLAQLTSRHDVVPMLRHIQAATQQPGFQGVIMCAGHPTTLAWARRFGDEEPFPDRFVTRAGSPSPFWIRPFWQLIERTHTPAHA